MLAVSMSTGADTAFHYDEGDDGVLHARLPLSNMLTGPGHSYFAILVLQTGGVLMLPELGYAIEARPGDMVFFLANQHLHKLDIDRSTPDPTQIVLTLWMGDGAIELANPVAQTLADFQPASSLSREVDSRYHVVEPTRRTSTSWLSASALVLVGGGGSLYCILMVHLDQLPAPWPQGLHYDP
jgi:hypothetical protein